jgi:hypothetical protein
VRRERTRESTQQAVQAVRPVVGVVDALVDCEALHFVRDQVPGAVFLHNCQSHSSTASRRCGERGRGGRHTRRDARAERFERDIPKRFDIGWEEKDVSGGVGLRELVATEPAQRDDVWESFEPFGAWSNANHHLRDDSGVNGDDGGERDGSYSADWEIFLAQSLQHVTPEVGSLFRHQTPDPDD